MAAKKLFQKKKYPVAVWAARFWVLATIVLGCVYLIHDVYRFEEGTVVSCAVSVALSHLMTLYPTGSCDYPGLNRALNAEMYKNHETIEFPIFAGLPGRLFKCPFGKQRKEPQDVAVTSHS